MQEELKHEIYPMASSMFFNYPNPGGKKAMKYNEVLVWVALFHVDMPFIVREIRDFVNANQKAQVSSRQVDCALRIFRTMGHVETTFSTREDMKQYRTTVKFKRFKGNHLE